MKATLTAVVAILVSFSCSLVGDADQQTGWSEEDRQNWYQATQGSRLIPETWFNALQQADSENKFASVEYLSDQFGFVKAPDSMQLKLPIGFAIDRQDDSKLTVSKLRWYEDQPSGKDDAEPWVGLNCAACHTAQLEFDGTPMIVDGGPNLLDFQLFIEEFDKALLQTRDDSEKWDQFAGEVLAGKDTEQNRALLKDSLDQFMAWQKLTDDMNETPVRYGYGRLDAVGHILNKILMFTGNEASDGNPANAPVSYPFLWNIWRQERVQWNGVASNSRIQFPGNGDTFEYGALGRNTGEVLGVFGDINVTKNDGILGALKGFDSSVQVASLMRLELLLQKLQPPVWPTAFPAIDDSLAGKGETLFNEKCASCHLPESQWQEGQPTEKMVSFFETNRDEPENLTDIWMACNAFIYKGKTGPLEGQKDNEGEEFKPVSPVVNMLAASVKGAIIKQKKELVIEGFNNFFGIRRPPVVFQAEPFQIEREKNRKECLETEGQLVLGYKARPLDGIWATAPYLHNGSVSSLYELLLPAVERQKSFWVGNRTFDPVKVGYSTQAIPDGKAFQIITRDAQGNAIPGNGNGGHEYGAADFSPEDRQALVEYMKGL